MVFKSYNSMVGFPLKKCFKNKDAYLKKIWKIYNRTGKLICENYREIVNPFITYNWERAKILKVYNLKDDKVVMVVDINDFAFPKCDKDCFI